LNTAPQAKLTISILNTGFTSSTIDPIALLPQSIQLFPNLLIDFSLILIIQLERDYTKGTLRLAYMQVNSLQQLEKTFTLCSVATVGMSLPEIPRADPCMRNYRLWLLSRVRCRALAWVQAIIHAAGSHVTISLFMRSNVMDQSF
jgi:hypothetical protein